MTDETCEDLTIWKSDPKHGKKHLRNDVNTIMTSEMNTQATNCNKHQTTNAYKWFTVYYSVFFFFSVTAHPRAQVQGVSGCCSGPVELRHCGVQRRRQGLQRSDAAGQLGRPVALRGQVLVEPNDAIPTLAWRNTK